MGNMIFAIYFFLLLGLMPAKGGARKPRSGWNTLLPLTWVLLSALIYLALELTTRFTRFLLPAQLAFALWLGRGFWVLWDLASPRSVAAAILPAGGARRIGVLPADHGEGFWTSCITIRIISVMTFAVW